MKRAVYAFSGDPITYGHIDIIRRVSRIFDHIVVGIGVNPGKDYLFSLEERTEMATHVLKSFSNVEVTPFTGLLVDFAYERGADVIVKGIRNATDLAYESVLHQVGISQNVGIDTHILMATPEFVYISSSMVKGVMHEQGDLHNFVPLYVKQQLERKISKQYIVCVTGGIGTGKSYVSGRLAALAKERGLEAYNIELDYIGHQITNSLMDDQYVKIRNKIIKTFGKNVGSADGFIDRKALGDIVFNDAEALKKLNEMLAIPLIVRLRREITGKKGLILINAALIAESGLAYLGNNNVILVRCDKGIQRERLLDRSMSDEQIVRRLAGQYTCEEKQVNLSRLIEESGQGELIEFRNDKASDTEINGLLDRVLGVVGLKKKPGAS